MRMPLKMHGVWLMALSSYKIKLSKKKKKIITREMIEKNIYKYYTVTK